MNMQQAMMAVALWQTRQFDTYDIAKALSRTFDLTIPESLVYGVVNAAREQVRAA